MARWCVVVESRYISKEYLEQVHWQSEAFKTVSNWFNAGAWGCEVETATDQAHSLVPSVCACFDDCDGLQFSAKNREDGIDWEKKEVLKYYETEPGFMAR